MIPRHITPRLLAALSSSPVVLLHGARQTGKSTLVRELARTTHPAQYITLDDPPTLRAIREDPVGFVDRLHGPVVFDEIQRAPELMVAIKLAVDRDRQPGRFLLTGSAQVLLLPRVSESLAGRMLVLTLWPLAQEEIEGRRTGLVDRLFAPTLELNVGPQRTAPDDVVPRALRGGYPEVVQRLSGDQRREWFASYVTTLLQRDVRDVSEIEELTLMPMLLALLAARSTGLLNVAELSRASGIAGTTLKRYLALLRLVFLVQTTPPWSGSLTRRLVKTPKVYLNDSGLLAYLLGMDEQQVDVTHPARGPLVESFVAMELQRQATWSDTRPQLLHYRTHAGQEVDAVLEARGGQTVGVEVKAGAAVGRDDFRGLRALAEQLGDKFVRGVVLYNGNNVLPFGPDLWAVPISALWS